MRSGVALSVLGLVFGLGAACSDAGDEEEIAESSQGVGETSTPGVAAWDRMIGGPSLQSAVSVAADATGGNYVTGDFMDTLTLGGTTMTSVSKSDGYLAKYNPYGTLQWAKHIAFDAGGAPHHLAPTPDGGVILTGTFDGGVTIDGHSRYGERAQKMFIVKLNGAGDVQWMNTIMSDQSVSIQAVTAAPNGNVLVGGAFGTNLVVDDRVYPQVAGRSPYVVELDTLGRMVWTRRFDPSGGGEVNGLGTDRYGNIYIGGWVAGAIDFGAGTGRTASDSIDAFVTKVSATHDYRWSKLFGDGASQQVVRMAVSPSGQIALAGHLLGAIDFGGGALVSDGRPNTFVAKLSYLGEHKWSKRWTGGETRLGGIKIDSRGNVDVAGSFVTSIRIGGVTMQAAGARDMFLAKMSPTYGTTIWRRQYGSAGSTVSASDLAVTPNDRILVSGTLTLGSVDFGKGTRTASEADGFLVRFYQ